MSKNKTKLLIIVKSVDGGTGTYVFQLLKLEKSINNSIVKVIVLEKPSFRKINKYSDKFIFDHDKNFYPQIYKFSLKNILNFIRELFWVKNQINEFIPDLVLSVDIHCNLIISLLKTLFFRKTKIILTTHINLEDNMEQRSDIILKFLLRKCVNFFYNRADSLIFVSKYLAENCINKFQLKRNIVSTIYNGIPLKKTVDFKHRDRKENIIVTISRLVEQKDHLTLLKAFSFLQNRVFNTYLWVISDGDKRKQLENYAKKLKVQNKTRFFGWVKDIYPYLKKASFFILSSKREGFALVLVEAMSQGLPVISTDTPYGPSEILDNGKYGILVPMGDEKAMAKAMYTLLTDEKKYNYYAQKSLERTKYFSLDKMLDAYKKIILDVINKP